MDMIIILDGGLILSKYQRSSECARGHSLADKIKVQPSPTRANERRGVESSVQKHKKEIIAKTMQNIPYLLHLNERFLTAHRFWQPPPCASVYRLGALSILWIIEHSYNHVSKYEIVSMGGDNRLYERARQGGKAG